jgi:hypothetical protein
VHPPLTTHPGSLGQGEAKGPGRATHLPPPSASMRSSPPKSSDTASSTSGLVESRRSSSSSSRHDAASQLAPALQSAAAAWRGQAHRTSRSARPAGCVGRAEGRGRGAPCEAGGAAFCAVGYATAGVGQRACIRGWQCVRAGFARQAEQADWVEAADNGKQAQNWFCRWGRQRSPPPAPQRYFSRPAEGLCEARAAFKPRTSCQTHGMRVSAISCDRTCAAHGHPTTDFFCSQASKRYEGGK